MRSATTTSVAMRTATWVLGRNTIGPHIARTPSAIWPFATRSRWLADPQAIGVELMIGRARRFGRRSCEGRSGRSCSPAVAGGGDCQTES
jgi:hypothetical protein